MAIRKRNVLGPISGKLDNIIIRQRYGKEVVYHKPDNYNISYSDKAVAGRKKFGNTVKLARLINSNPELSAVWKTAKCKGTNSYQKIIKHNSSFTSADGLTQKNIITPAGLYTAKPELIIDGSHITVKIEIDENLSGLSATGYSLFSLTSSVGSDLFLIESNNVNVEEKSVKCEFVFSEDQLLLFNNAQKSILLSSFCFKNAKNKIVAWTNSFSFEVNNFS